MRDMYLAASTLQRPKEEKQTYVSVESMPNTVIQGVLIKQA